MAFRHVGDRKTVVARLEPHEIHSIGSIEDMPVIV